jgi:hypothetical protein
MNFRRRPVASTVFGIATALALTVGAHAQAQRTTATLPTGFDSMAGRWTGEGTIRTTNGGSERIRCRATYQAYAENGLRQELLCASDSYKFEVRSDFVQKSGAISGQWAETSRNLSGNVSGKANGNTIQAKVEGGGFAAQLSVATNGNRQAVTIVPQGTDVVEVTVNMSRSVR